MKLRSWILISTLALSACGGSTSREEAEAAGGAGGGGGSSTSTSSGTGGNGGSGGGSGCDTPANPKTFEVGTGEKCFARVLDGGEVPLMNGPQGGYHVWLAIGCSDCAPVTHLRFGAHDPVTQQPFPGTSDTEQMLPLSNDPWAQRAGVTVYMPGVSWDPENEPPPPKGTHMILWSDSLDAGNQVVHHDEVEIVIGDTQTWDPCAENPNDPACQFG